MSDNSNTVECSIHGQADAAYVCQHLVKGKKRGFFVGYEDDNVYVKYPDAWCQECEKIREQQGGWDDISEAFAGIKQICGRCYESIREKNWVENEEAFNVLLKESVSYLQNVQQDFIKKYNINDYDHWDWNQDTGKLLFSKNGRATVEADIQFVGTFSTVSKTWLWAWANDSMVEKVTTDVKHLRDRGEEYNIMKLVSAHWDATIVDGWEMTSIMANHFKAIGAYRTPGDEAFTYMIVKEAEWLD